MDWGDILVKIGVGACLGFGLITLAKLTKKKNKQDQKTEKNAAGLRQGQKESTDKGSNKK